MKLQAISAPAGGTSSEEPEEENMARAVLQAAQKKVVSQVSGWSQLQTAGTIQVWWYRFCAVKFQLLNTCFDSQVQKKAFIENTVPLIISLKSLLEQKHSPVLRDLMAYLQVTPPLCIFIPLLWVELVCSMTTCTIIKTKQCTKINHYTLHKGRIHIVLYWIA